MTRSAALLELLREHGVSPSGAPVLDVEASNRFFVFIEISRDPEGHQQPTNRKLADIAERLMGSGFDVQFLLTDSSTADVEGGLRATLLHQFPNEVRNSFVSVRDGEAFVWVDQKRVLTPEILDAISASSIAYFEKVGLRLGGASSLSNSNTPGKLAILKAVRLLSPAGATEIIELLRTANFNVPNEAWTVKKLDAIRKSGEILRTERGGYALTAIGIAALGTVKNRSSPDVKRVLALARRRS